MHKPTKNSVHAHRLCRICFCMSKASRAQATTASFYPNTVFRQCRPSSRSVLIENNATPTETTDSSQGDPKERPKLRAGYTCKCRIRLEETVQRREGRKAAAHLLRYCAVFFLSFPFHSFSLPSLPFSPFDLSPSPSLCLRIASIPSRVRLFRPLSLVLSSLLFFLF